MLPSRRRRYGSPVILPATRGHHRWVGVVLVLCVAALAVFLLSRAFLPGVTGQRVATILAKVRGGTIGVTLRGEQEQRAEAGLRLYDGDALRTDDSARALLQFFDGSLAALGPATHLEITEIVSGEESSLLALRLGAGALWVGTSTGMQVTRTVETPLGEYAIPPRARAIIRAAGSGEDAEESLLVFETAGPGIVVTLRNVRGSRAEVIVGEGQRMRLPARSIARIREGEIDPYELRDPLRAEDIAADFSVHLVQEEAPPAPAVTAPEREAIESEQLVIDAPADGALLPGATVLVQGRVGSRVRRVIINGYSADFTEEGTFAKEIALPESESVTVEVQAEDQDGIIVATKTLALARDIRPPDPPVITVPGSSGAIVAVQEESFEIVGEASPDTTGIVVNGYQLQKYTPGKSWHYLVDPAIGNVKVGENSYEIIALDRSGNRSAPARITVVWKAEPFPVTPEDPTRGSSATPLAPGSLRITVPGESPFVTTDAEVLLEGETSPETAVISVNGFTLSKYAPGKETWNYIAAERFGNYRKGVNRFVIVTRNAAGQILDVLRYVVEWRD